MTRASRIPSLICVCLALVASQSSAQHEAGPLPVNANENANPRLEQSVRSKVWDWRTEIARSHPYDSGPAFRYESCKPLLAMGPSILPEIASLMREEQDPVMLNQYCLLFAHLSRFEVYVFTEEPLEVLGVQLQDKDQSKRTLLSAPMGALRGPSARTAQVIRDLYLNWWDLRGRFPAPADRKAAFRAISAPGGTLLSAPSSAADRRLQRDLAVYGIYNIPIFIDLAGEGDPLAFVEFLRASQHESYSELDMTASRTKNAAVAKAAYPTVESRIGLMANWWAENSGKYQKLTDLHSQITEAVSRAASKIPKKEG